MVGIKTTGEQISILCHNGTIFDKLWEKLDWPSKDTLESERIQPVLGTDCRGYICKIVQIQQLMGVHMVSAFHPFIFQKSGKSTIIRNLAVPRHFVAYLVFISSIRVDPEIEALNSGKHGEIKVHRSSACGIRYTFPGVLSTLVPHI